MQHYRATGTETLLEDLFGEDIDPADRQDVNFSHLAQNLQGVESRRLPQKFKDGAELGSLRTDVSILLITYL